VMMMTLFVNETIRFHPFYFFQWQFVQIPFYQDILFLKQIATIMYFSKSKYRQIFLPTREF